MRALIMNIQINFLSPFLPLGHFKWANSDPCVPEDFFLSILMVRGEAESTRRASAERKKNNLWSQELLVSFPCNFKDHISHQTGLELMCMFVFIDTDWDLRFESDRRVALHLLCMKKELRESAKAQYERKLLLKIVTNSFPKDTLQVSSM